MKTNFILICNEAGSVRTTKNMPRLEANEVALQITLELPSALFKRPQITGSIIVPESAVSKEPIQAIVLDKVKETIEGVMGVEVNLTVTYPGDAGQ